MGWVSLSSGSYGLKFTKQTHNPPTGVDAVAPSSLSSSDASPATTPVSTNTPETSPKLTLPTLQDTSLPPVLPTPTPSPPAAASVATVPVEPSSQILAPTIFRVQLKNGDIQKSTILKFYGNGMDNLVTALTELFRTKFSTTNTPKNISVMSHGNNDWLVGVDLDTEVFEVYCNKANTRFFVEG